MTRRNITAITLAILTGIGACTSLEVLNVGETVAVGGMGGAGAASGSSVSGQGGDKPPPTIDCSWHLPQHIEVESLEGKSGPGTFNPMVVSRLGPELLRVALRRDGKIQVRTVGASINTATIIDGTDLFNFARLSAFSEGLLYAVDADPLTKGYQAELRLLRLSDTDTNLTSFTSSTVVEPTGFVDLDPLNFKPQALLVARPSQGLSCAIDFVVVHSRQGAPITELIESYGRWDCNGGSPVDLVQISPPRPKLYWPDAVPTILVHREGKTHGFFGSAFSKLGTRGYVLDENTSGPLIPRVLEPVALTLVSANDSAAGTSLLGVNVGPPYELLIGQVGNEELAAIDINSDLSVFLSAPTYADVKVQGAIGWLGDIAAFVGKTLVKPNSMNYAFYDTDGIHRGQGELAFTALLDPEITRQKIKHVAFDVADIDFSENGGLAHVIWIEEQQRSTGGDGGGSDTFEVMYFDQLNCVLSTP